MTATGVHFLDAAAPEGIRLYAIGDVHGRADLLAAMHAAIRAEIIRDRPADWRIIHLGDYVDRGPDLAGVVEMLSRACAQDERMLALAGNHDVGLLDFLAHPESAGLFARFGGYETALSYGVEIDFSSQRSAADGGRRLGAAMAGAHLDFLRRLPRAFAFGDFFFCHAGVRPGISLEAQNPEDLIWIRDEFLNWPHLFAKVVVHGHTPHHEPQVLANRINLDTLAWKSGRLTALVVDGTKKRLIAETMD